MKKWLSELSKKEKKRLFRIAAAAALFILARILPVGGWVAALCYLAPYALIGYDVLWRAVRNIARGQVFDENFLMAVATIGAYAIGDYPEAVFVMLFYQVGELFQDIAVSRSRRSIAQLMDIRPDTALVLRDGSTEEADPEDVEIGEVILVRPGDRIALDGEVIEGESCLDTSALTGESALRDVAPGESVVSGCVNRTGVLHVRVTKSAEDSTVSRILEMVEEASEKKARSENFITKFARYYTPAVVFAALALAFIPPIFVGNFTEWFHRALLFLVISCPCALVISVPLGFFGGIGGAARRGILIKGGNYMETLAAVDTIVFDKTGTLTENVKSLRGRSVVSGFSPEEVWEKAALCEYYSNHPVARSLRSLLEGDVDESRISDVEEKTGLGVCATVDGVRVCVGSARLMQEETGHAPDDSEDKTTVHVAIGGKYAGLIRTGDVIKENAAEMIAQVRKCGVKRTIMLTGDGESAAKEIAAQIGLDEYRAGLLPQDKVRCMEEILAGAKGDEAETAGGHARKQRGLFGGAKGTAAYVGDGINDAPVLTRADVGIAMGALGSDAAIEAADVVLMNDDLGSIGAAIAIARKTIGIVRQNIVFALAAKGAVLVLGALGYAPMWLAVFADVGVAFIAILNSMRALR